MKKAVAEAAGDTSGGGIERKEKEAGRAESKAMKKASASAAAGDTSGGGIKERKEKEKKAKHKSHC